MSNVDLEKMIPPEVSKFLNDLLAKHEVPELPEGFGGFSEMLGWSAGGGRAHLEVAMKHPIRLLVNALTPTQGAAYSSPDRAPDTLVRSRRNHVHHVILEPVTNNTTPSPLRVPGPAARLGVALAWLSCGFASAQRTPVVAAEPAQRFVAVVIAGADVHIEGDAYGLRAGARAPEPLGFRMDRGGGEVLYHGTTGPLLSPDGRWLAYRSGRVLQVRDLLASTRNDAPADGAANGAEIVSGSVRVLPTTLAPVRGGCSVMFASDSSSLLYIDFTLIDDEGPGYLEGVYRIYTLATGAVRPVVLNRDTQRPVLLENANSLLFTQAAGRERTLLKRYQLSPEGHTQAEIAFERFSEGFGQLTAAREELAWIGRIGIMVGDRDAQNARQVTPGATRGEYQLARFAPTATAMLFAHTFQWDTHPTGSLATHVTHMDRRTRRETDLYRCRSACLSAIEDEGHVLVVDGRNLLRVDLQGRSRRLRGNVWDVAFAGIH